MPRGFASVGHQQLTLTMQDKDSDSCFPRRRISSTFTICVEEKTQTIFSWASCQTHKIAGAHARGILGTVSPSPQVSDPYMHHGTCVTHVPWCMPGSLTSGFLWKRRRGNFPGIPGACATCNFTYLVRGPCIVKTIQHAKGWDHVIRTTLWFILCCYTYI